MVLWRHRPTRWARDVTAGEPWSRLPNQVTDLSADVSGLVNRHVYEFKLQPVKGWQEAEEDIRSNVVLLSPIPAPPHGPQTLSAAADDYAANLVWSSVRGASGYFIWRRNASAGTAWSRLADPVGGNSTRVTGLVAGDRYEFKVQATNDGADGGYSPVVSAVATGPIPLAVKDLTVRAIGYETAELNWTNARHATSYRITFRNVSKSGAWQILTTRTPITSGPRRVQGLLPGDRYAFRVQSWNMHVRGGRARPVTLRVPLLPAVTGVTATTARRNVVAVTGRGVPAATSYRVYVAERSCSSVPIADQFRLFRSGLDRSATALRTEAASIWLKLVAVRSEVEGKVVRSSLDCAKPLL